MRNFVTSIFGVLLLALSLSAFAVDHAVIVGGGGLVFKPATLTINQGDTVTFTNAGGFHNVVADDGSFRCATDCASGGDASSGAWSDTITYNTVGTFGYHCEIHGGPGAGMAGSITVAAVTAPPPPTGQNIVGGLSGSWNNAGLSGSGFQLDVTSDGDQMLAVWFVFDPAGGSRWIYGQGTYDSSSNTITMPAVLVDGGKFPQPLSNYVNADIQKPSWGTLTFTFSDCNNVTVAWNSTIAGYGAGSMALTRLTHIAGLSCP